MYIGVKIADNGACTFHVTMSYFLGLLAGDSQLTVCINTMTVFLHTCWSFLR